VTTWQSISDTCLTHNIIIISFLVFLQKFCCSPFNNVSNRKTTKYILTVSYIITGFNHKDFTIAAIYYKLQRIDLGVSKSTNINTIIKNGEAFGIKQLYHDLGRSCPTNFAKYHIGFCHKTSFFAFVGLSVSRITGKGVDHKFWWKFLKV